jgi:subtilisin family serine protease
MPHARTLRAALLAGVAVLAAACADGTPSPTAPAAPAGPDAAAPTQIPSRSQARPGALAAAQDAQLWDAVRAGGNTAVVGLRAPGMPRGIWRGRVLMTRGQWARSRAAVLEVPGVRLVEADELLPTLRVTVADAAALRALRRRAEVDYVEPLFAENDLPQQFAGVGGCGWGDAWTGDRQLTSTGDVYSQKFTAMGIPQAWTLSSGAGVTVGLTDTGISSTQGQFTSTFATGASAGRTLKLLKVSSMSSVYDSCGHGTRMAGIIAAPRDGQSVGGIAYRANFVSVRQADGVAAVSSSDAKASVRAAVQNGAQVVVMAWESLNWWWQVSDEIEYWHYSRPVLFMGAAGTSGCGDIIWDDNVVFPADMPEVVAVTGVTYPSGGVPCGIHYGPEVELTAYLDVPSTGRYTGDVVGMGGSSNATAVAGSVAALVWSRNPGLTRDQLRARLQQTASYWPSRHPREGYGLINAYRAVSGT